MSKSRCLRHKWNMTNLKWQLFIYLFILDNMFLTGVLNFHRRTDWNKVIGGVSLSEKATDLTWFDVPCFNDLSDIEAGPFACHPSNA